MKATAPWLMVALLLGCGGETPSDDTADTTGKAEKCARCGALAGVGGPHQCGYSQWCGSCLKDKGEFHRCNVTVYCKTCRRDGDKPARGTAGGTHVCGVTEICSNCLRLRPNVFEEHARVHVCGQTHLCPTCNLNVGPGHSCRAESFFCPACHTERLHDGHICGLSSFCPECRTEASVPRDEHEHMVTRFCRPCRREVELPHRHE